MTADTGASPALARALGDLLGSPPDEFDLDIRWGELGQAGSWADYLPTAGENPHQETCDTHAATCSATCQPTCPATCPETCHVTCRDTCGATCAEVNSCGGTCANTHCFTCRSGCETP
jgi:hypothetical protein